MNTINQVSQGRCYEAYKLFYQSTIDSLTLPNCYSVDILVYRGNVKVSSSFNIYESYPSVFTPLTSPPQGFALGLFILTAVWK